MAATNTQNCLDRLVINSNSADNQNSCNKVPEIKNCLNIMYAGTQPCLTENEQSKVKFLLDSVESLVKSICNSRTLIEDEVRLCSSSSNLNNVPQCLTNIPKDAANIFNGAKKECGQLSELQTCVLSVLKTCDMPNTIRIAKEAFGYIGSAMSCSGFPTNSACGLAVATATMILAGVPAIFV